MELPRGWAWATMPDLIGGDGLFTDGDWVETKDQDPTGDVRLTQLADVGEGTFRDRSNRFMTADSAAHLGCTYLQTGDVLIARMPDPLGRACIFPADQRPAVTAVDVCVVRPGASSVEPRWLMWWINTPQFRAEVIAQQTGTTRKRISRKNLASIRFPLPPLSEQQRIVAAVEEHLSRLERAVTEVGAAASRTKRLKLLILNAVFSREDETAPLQELADVRLGRQRSPKNHFGPTMRPYLRAANVTWNGLKLDDVKEMNFSVSEAATYELRAGDVLLAEASGSASEVGKPVVWRGEIPGCCFQNTLIRVRSRGPRPEYLRLVFLRAALLGQFAQAAPGVGIHHLGSSRLAEWPTPLWSDDKQLALAERVERQFSLIDAVVDKLSAVRRRGESLRRVTLAHAFRGELVPQDPDDEPASLLLERIAAERAAARAPTRKRKEKMPA